MTDAAKDYASVTGKMLYSDQPAYAALHALTGVRGRKVLEVGAFFGDHARGILAAGAKGVMGIDVNPDFVSQAQEKHRNTKNLSFSQVEIGADYPQFPDGDNPDVVLIPFVHPVVEDPAIIQGIANNSYNVLETGGVVAFMGLHPHAFSPGKSIHSYDLSIAGGEYRDGAKIFNRLKFNDGGHMDIIDFARTQPTMEDILLQAGFQDVQTHSVSLNMGGDAQLAVKATIDRLKQEGIDISAELEIPVHQIFLAYKPKNL